MDLKDIKILKDLYNDYFGTLLIVDNLIQSIEHDNCLTSDLSFSDLHILEDMKEAYYNDNGSVVIDDNYTSITLDTITLELIINNTHVVKALYDVDSTKFYDLAVFF